MLGLLGKFSVIRHLVIRFCFVIRNSSFSSSSSRRLYHFLRGWLRCWLDGHRNTRRQFSDSLDYDLLFPAQPAQHLDQLSPALAKLYADFARFVLLDAVNLIDAGKADHRI